MIRGKVGNYERNFVLFGWERGEMRKALSGIVFNLLNIIIVN